MPTWIPVARFIKNSRYAHLKSTVGKLFEVFSNLKDITFILILLSYLTVMTSFVAFVLFLQLSNFFYMYICNVEN